MLLSAATTPAPVTEPSCEHEPLIFFVILYLSGKFKKNSYFSSKFYLPAYCFGLVPLGGALLPELNSTTAGNLGQPKSDVPNLESIPLKNVAIDVKVGEGVLKSDVESQFSLPNTSVPKQLGSGKEHFLDNEAAATNISAPVHKIFPSSTSSESNASFLDAFSTWWAKSELHQNRIRFCLKYFS